MIDLHTHSSASDGQLSPSDLVAYAARHGISVLALTDHDTVAGIPEAAEAARAAGITFVPGVELNVQWPTGEFHLLGLGLKKTSVQLNAVISYLQNGRNERNEQMARKLTENGMPVTLKELETLFPGAVIGRPHFADYLVQKHYVKARQLAFDKFLAKGRPCYVERTGIQLAEAVSAINDAGGVPVLAHPLSLYVSWGKLEGVLTDVHRQGVIGFEAWHPGARKGEAERLEALARKLGCFVTAGSDFHGEKIRADRRIGHTSGMEKIDDRFWTEELAPHIV